MEWYSALTKKGRIVVGLITITVLVATAIVGYQLKYSPSRADSLNGQAAKTTSTPATKGRAVGIVPDQILIKFKTSDATAIKAVKAKYGLTEKGEIKGIDVKIFKVPPVAEQKIFQRLLGPLSGSYGGPADIAAKINKSEKAAVEFAEVDTIYEPSATPNDPKYSSQWHLNKIAAPTAWDTTIGNPAVTVAIIDTGVDSDHPDLVSKLVPGWNYYNNNSDTEDLHGHGTGIAGIAAAATNNSLLVAGVGWDVKIMPIRISGADGYGSESAIANGLVFAADKGVRVANISYRMSESSTVTQAAKYLQNRGGVTTVAAGNQGEVISAPDNPSVLTVGATDTADAVPSWSNTGNIIDLVAPGQNITSTFFGGGYGVGTGTSGSAPQVAGVAALMLSVNPSLTATQIQDVLKQSADDLGPTGWDSRYGWGRLNADNAISMATNLPNPGTNDTSAPTTPTNLVGQVADANKVTLTWTSSTDNVGVAGYKIYRDSVELATSTTTTYSDATVTAGVTYSYSVKAFDAAGNYSASSNTSTVEVTTDTTAPSATITSPVAGATVSKSVTVVSSVSDNVGVTKVELYVDGKLTSSSLTSPFNTKWNTAKAIKGLHSLQIKAYDAAGNVGVSSVVSVTK